MERLRVGGVPEHVNVPWYVALEEGAFAELGVEVEWQDCPGGTGQMCAALADQTLDVALVLTEGMVAHVGAGGRSRVIGTYVETPLFWGIHTRADGLAQDAEDLRGSRHGISRLGSGSHLMAFVNAAQRGWGPDEQPRFVEVKNLEGALDAFRAGLLDAFLWERFMTQPWVDSGLLRRVGMCTAPWPAFVIAARPDVIEQRAELLGAVVERVGQVAARLDVARFQQEASRRFGLKPDEVELWRSWTRWSCRLEVETTALQEASRYLHAVGVLPAPLDPHAVLAPQLCRLV